VHPEADALLLAEYARRLWHTRNGETVVTPKGLVEE
jgi:hypothetical protein